VLLSEAFEDFYAMPLPTGQWNIVSGGNNGILDITNVGAPGTTGALPRNIGTLPVIVAGTLQLAQNSTLNISGTWDETHQELYFSDAEGQNRYRGYLFNAGDPLFNAPPGPPAKPHWHILAGVLQYRMPSVLEPSAIAKVVVVAPPVNLFPTITTGWMARLVIS
jgi:hypothetical protein